MIFHCHATIILERLGRTTHGGGVGLYVNCSYQFRERDDLAVNIDDVIESQFIELTSKPKNTLIGIIYRPPNSRIEQFIEHALLRCFKNLTCRIRSVI